MTRPRLKVLSTLLVVCLLAGRPVQGQDPADPEELEELLAALETAGEVPSAAEQQYWQREVEPQGSRNWTPGHGDLSWTGRWEPGRNWRHAWRLQVAGGPARVRLKARQDQDGDRAIGGALEILQGRQKLVLGQVGIQGGFGLLLARSGRGGSPAADGNLGRLRTTVAGWASEPDDRTVRGVGLDLARGSWRILGLTGRAAGGQDVKAGAIALSSGQSQLGAAGISLASGQGACVWAGARTSLLSWAAEVAHWRAAGTGSGQFSWLAVVGLAGPLHTSLELGLAHGGFPDPPGLGVRPALLHGNQGQGWALRGKWRPRPGWLLALLSRSSWRRVLLSQPVRDRFRSWDLIASLPPGPGWDLNFRIRWQQTRRWNWSPRFAWQPGQQEISRESLLLSGQLRWVSAPLEMRVGLRVLRLGIGTEAGRRALASLDFRRSLAAGWLLRTGHGTAWGQDVDLLSAAAPLPAVVMPRHWGDWRAESYVGLGRYWRGWELWLAGSLRSSEEPATSRVFQGWGSLRLKW